jgi:hypothetical protein
MTHAETVEFIADRVRFAGLTRTRLAEIIATSLSTAEQEAVVRAYKTLAVEEKLRTAVILRHDSLYTT